MTRKGDSGIDVRACTPDGRGGDVACDEPGVTPRKRRCSPFENIRRVTHQRAVSKQSERIIGCQSDFLEMTEATEDHYISFTKDRRPSSAASGKPGLLRPDILDEMVQLVSKVRQNRIEYL